MGDSILDLEKNKLKSESEILDSKEEIRKRFEYYENHLEQEEIDQKVLEEKDNIDRYIIDKMKSVDLEYTDYMKINNYVSVLYEFVYKNPSLKFSNPILNLDKETILKFIDKDKYNNIINISTNAYKKSMEIYYKFIEDENSITKEEFKYLITFFTNNIEFGYDSKKMEELTKKILNSSNEYNDLRTKYFIFKYLTHKKSQELGGKIYLYLCDDKFKDKNATKKFVLGKQENNRVYINCLFFRNTKVNDLKTIVFDPIIDIDTKNLTQEEIKILEDKYFEKFKKEGIPLCRTIQALYHEIKHVKQYFDLKNNEFTSDSVARIEADLFRKYLGEEEYNKNYRFYDVEIDANVSSYDNTVLLYEKFCPEYYSKIKRAAFIKKLEEEAKKCYSYKKDNDDEKYMNDYFIVENLNKILENNPEEIKKYKQLSAFYTYDGKLKPIEVLLHLMVSNRDENKDSKSFEKFITYHIEKGSLKNINLLHFSDIEILEMLLALNDVAFDLIKDICIINEQYDEIKEKEEIKTSSICSIILKKINLIIKIDDFYNKNLKNIKFKNVLKTNQENLQLLEKAINELEQKLNIKFLDLDIDEIISNKKIR